jgi:outer membrane protein assembly factor BamB
MAFPNQVTGNSNCIFDAMFETMNSTLKFKLLAIFFSIASGSSHINAQHTFKASYSKIYNKQEDMEIHDFQKTSNGFIMAGQSTMQGVLVRFDTSGNIIWEKKYKATESQNIYSVQQTLDNGFVFAGDKSSFDGCNLPLNKKVTVPKYGEARTIYCWVGKADANGIMQWQTCLGNKGSYQAWCIKPTKDSGFVVVATANDAENRFITKKDNLWVLKLDKSGNVQWQKKMGGKGSTLPFNVEQDMEGNYVISATNEQKEDGKAESSLIKLNNQGNIIWDTRFNIKSSLGFAQPNIFSLTKDGGFITCILVDSIKENKGKRFIERSYALVKFDSKGVLSWQRNIPYDSSLTLLTPPRIFENPNSSFSMVAVSLKHISGFLLKPTSYFMQLDASGNILAKLKLGETLFALNAFQTGQNKFVVGGGIKEEGRSGEGSQRTEGFFIMEIMPE